SPVCLAKPCTFKVTQYISPCFPVCWTATGKVLDSRHNDVSADRTLCATRSPFGSLESHTSRSADRHHGRTPPTRHDPHPRPVVAGQQLLREHLRSRPVGDHLSLRQQYQSVSVLASDGKVVHRRHHGEVMFPSQR